MALDRLKRRLVRTRIVILIGCAATIAEMVLFLSLERACGEDAFVIQAIANFFGGRGAVIRAMYEGWNTVAAIACVIAIIAAVILFIKGERKKPYDGRVSIVAVILTALSIITLITTVVAFCITVENGSGWGIISGVWKEMSAIIFPLILVFIAVKFIKVAQKRRDSDSNQTNGSMQSGNRT